MLPSSTRSMLPKQFTENVDISVLHVSYVVLNTLFKLKVFTLSYKPYDNHYHSITFILTYKPINQH
jgi:hypothetical protein